MGDDASLTSLISQILVLLTLSAFFSGSETALMSLNRYQLRHKARQGHRGARLAESLHKRPDRVIGHILLGNNLVKVYAASIVGVYANKIGGEPAAAIGAVILTLDVLIIAKAAPKKQAALHPDRLDYRVEVGTQLLCIGTEKKKRAHLAEGRAMLESIAHLPGNNEDERREIFFARQLLESPGKACGYTGDKLVDLEAEGDRAKADDHADG